ncbi:hypothetical protein PVAG01_05572 [Phlyctema vagabunda]|uniref:Uncharacterized protein n=1 Tax=Phlyctema vagabunda TaxID=108571 RepID=A0ABR4PKF6_9HELO
MSSQEEALRRLNISNNDEETEDSSEDETSSEDSTSSEDEDDSEEDGVADEGEEGQYIEMSLGLGVLEQIRAGEDVPMPDSTTQPPSGSPTTAAKRKEAGQEEVINFQPKDKKPKFVLEQNPNSVANRLPDFLAKIKAANEQLRKADTKSYRIEVDDDSDVEEKAAGEASKSKSGPKSGGIEEV